MRHIAKRVHLPEHAGVRVMRTMADHLEQNQYQYFVYQ